MAASGLDYLRHVLHPLLPAGIAGEVDGEGGERNGEEQVELRVAAVDEEQDEAIDGDRFAEGKGDDRGGHKPLHRPWQGGDGGRAGPAGGLQGAVADVRDQGEVDEGHAEEYQPQFVVNSLGEVAK